MVDAKLVPVLVGKLLNEEDEIKVNVREQFIAQLHYAAVSQSVSLHEVSVFCRLQWRKFGIFKLVDLTVKRVKQCYTLCLKQVVL